MGDWLAIKGRKFLWEDFVDVLDRYRHEAVIRTRGSKISREYACKICVLQEAVFVCHEGRDHIDSRLEDYIRRHSMEIPAERKLPEAVEELFCQLESSLKVNLSDLLDDCAEQSEKTYCKMQEREKKEIERIAFVKSLPVPHGDIGDEDAVKKVSYLMMLQKAKIGHPDYHVSRCEVKVTDMWCEMLVLSLSSDRLTRGILQKAVENCILNEDDVTRLLAEKYQIHKEYELYVDDFMGCPIGTSTDIKIKDFLELCEGRFRDVLGIPLG